MRSFRGLALALVTGTGVLVASASADAKNVYRWETEEGVVSFTDELKRVPERYRDQVKQIDTKTLSSVKRFSEMATPAEAAHAGQVEARLEELRARSANGGAGGAVEGAMSPATVDGFSLSGVRRDGTRMRSVDDVMPTLDLGAVDNEAPVVVEEIRVRSDSSSPNVTRRVTVIRQGDRVLAVIKPDARRHYGMDLPDESEVEAGR